MKISNLIEQLQREQERHGDIEVTCTGTYLEDEYGPGPNSTVFETTVETLKFIKKEYGFDETYFKLGLKDRIRLFL